MASAVVAPPSVLGTLSGATPLVSPQGRLCLTTLTPVHVATVSAQATIFYTPYEGGNVIPIYNGASWGLFTFSELSNATAQSSTGSAGPAVVANSSNYDLFVWNNAGTLTLTRGPLWTSDTARGSGAGTTQLTLTNGIYVNTVAITNGPGAGLGTYVGSFRSNGTATTDMNFGASAAGGTAGILGVWNCYNRVSVKARTLSSTAGYTYTSSTTRQAEGSTGMQCSFIRGLNEDVVDMRFSAKLTSPAAITAAFTLSIGLDSTTTSSADANQPTVVDNANAVSGQTPTAVYAGYPGLGYHVLSANEAGDNTNQYTIDPRFGSLQTITRA